jgi:hypothetical protein
MYLYQVYPKRHSVDQPALIFVPNTKKPVDTPSKSLRLLQVSLTGYKTGNVFTT